ncbi:MAG: CsbD family protein [Chthoniobacterales bacterium]
MNWDQVEGKWKQSKGKFREKWGKLTDDDLTVISGKRDQLVGRLQERYGIAKEEAERQADAFVQAMNEQDEVAAARTAAGKNY